MSILLPAEALARASDSQLVALASAIETELTRRAAEAAQPEGTEVLEVRPHSQGCFRLERVRCGKPNCRCMRGGSGHGPYWYLDRRKADGRLTSTYVGKKLPGSETSTTDRAPATTER